MGSLSCRCCSEKDDEGPGLRQDLKILDRPHELLMLQQESTNNGLFLALTDFESVEIDYINHALCIFLSKKTLKRLRTVSEFEQMILKRLSPDAAKVRQVLGPYRFEEGRSLFRSVLTVAPGVNYVGEIGIADRKPCGRGLMVQADGSVLEGYWQAGVLHGKGRRILPNGDCYIGDWAHGAMEGRGQLQCSDRHCYDGEWLKNSQHGTGEEKWADGASFLGSFKSGQKEGRGTFYWSDGSIYEGEVRRDMLDGKGTYLWGDGKKYEGHWKANKMHGYGRFEWPDGKVYEGNYENDQKNGFGVFTWADGRRYEGGWRDNQRHGKGVEYIKGIPIAGVWHNGKKVGPAVLS